jgi:hypothetical protein
MTLHRMCQLAKLPRASFYRWQPQRQGPDPDLELLTPSNASRWNSPVTAARVSPPSCAAAAESSIPRRSIAFRGKTTCCACGGGSSF